MGVSLAAVGNIAFSPARREWASAPWLMLVKPAACWRTLREQPNIWPAIIWQLCAVALSRLVSVHAMTELDAAARIAPLAGNNSWAWFGLSLAMLMLLVVGANFGLALIIKAASMFAGSKLSWGQAASLAVYALLPFAMGDALGRVAFAMILPLSTTGAGAWAMHLRPFSLGLMSVMPAGYPALSLPWYFASFFDIFGWWSLACIGLGLRHFARLRLMRSLWIMLGVVLLLALVLAAVWQTSQLALLRAAH